jgi:6,7-dimethyl-8-ribityllumazine synthase
MIRVLIVDADFYRDLAAEMVRGAMAELDARGISYDRVSVPGALEIPTAISIASKRVDGPAYDGYVALGCVIRGETSHYDVVCGESARGLTELALTRDLAIGNGILTVDNSDQAWARAGVHGNGKNKGKDAVVACLSLVDLKVRYRV